MCPGMPNRTLLLLGLVVVGLTAWFASRPGEDHGATPLGADDPSLPARAPEPALARARPAPPTNAEAIPGPWWILAEIESFDPAVRSARIEAHWWPTEPAPPYEGAAAAFGADVLLVGQRARVTLTGNARPGWAALFVVEDGRPRLACPWLDKAAIRVTPGYGSGPVVGFPVRVGTRSLGLRLIDTADLPVVGAELYVHDPLTNVRQAASTGVDGRARVDGLGAPEVQVGWRAPSSAPHWPERIGTPYADGEPRFVRVTDGEVVLRAPRRALLRVRGRVEGTPGEAWLPVDRYSLTWSIGPRRDVGTTVSEASHGIWVDPGAYRVGRPPEFVSTPTLQADQEVTVDLPLSARSGDGWLDIAFDRRARPGDGRMACAVEARRLSAGIGGQDRKATAPHDRMLLLLAAGAYEVTGAIRVDGVVRLSGARQIEVRPGEGVSITLNTAAAGALRLAGPPRGRGYSLLGRAFPVAELVAASTFRFEPLHWPREGATWWLSAGSYVLHQFDLDEPRSEHRLPFEVQEGAVTRLLQDETGWFTSAAR